MTRKKSDKVALPEGYRKGRPPSSGLYIDITCIDGRTRLGKAISALKRELREFVGIGTPASELLIQRIVFKSIRLSLYEANTLSNPVDVKQSDHYLPMSNSLRLDLQALAQLAGKPKAPDLEDYLKSKYGDK